MEKIKRAIRCIENDNMEGALRLLNDALQTATNDEKFRIYELYYEWGFFDKAIVILEELLAFYPGEGELIIPLSEMYIELEKDDKAIALLHQIEPGDPYYLDGLLHLADVYQAQGLFEVAEQKLLAAKQIAPDEIVIDFAMGEFLFSTGQANRAITFYEKVMEQTNHLNNVDIRERLAECYALIGHYEIALDFFGKMEVENPDTLFKYGLTAKGAKQFDIAIDVWERLIDLDPHYHSVYTELAAILLHEGRTRDAFHIAKKGLTQDEYNKELYFICGKLALQLKKPEEAINFLHEAVALDPEYQEAFLLLIQLYKEREEFEQIIELAVSIITVGVSDPLLDLEIARAYAGLEQYEKARKAYTDASGYLMDDSVFLREYGYFLLEEGLTDEAIPILRKYVNMDPDDEETGLLLERLTHANDD